MNHDEEYKRDFINFGVFRCWECDFSLEYYGEIEWVKSYGLDKARENYNVAKGYSANAKRQLEKLNSLISDISIKGNNTLMYFNDPLVGRTK